MKMISKKVLTTTLAASVLLGGGVVGLLQSKAFADTISTTATQTTDQAGNQPKGKPGQKAGGFDHRGGFGGSNLVKHTAAILNSDEKSISELAKNQSLLSIAENAGLTEEDFLQRLTAAVTGSIDEALSAGKLTQEQADKQKSGLAEQLKQSITTNKIVGERGPGKEGKRGNLFGDHAALAGIVGITHDELKTQLDEGKTLLQVSEANGVTKDNLVQALRAIRTKAIDDAVNSGQITAAQADEQRTQLTYQVEKFINEAQMFHDRGHGKGGDKGLHFLGNTDTLTTVLGVTKDELKAAQDAGKSLSEIAAEKGVSEDTLISKLKDGITDQLKQFVQNKRTPRPEQTQAPTADTEASE